MAEPDVLVNHDTGETWTLAEYIDEQKRIDLDILRIDAAIETHRAGMKAGKEAKEKAYRDLRAVIRAIALLKAAERRAHAAERRENPRGSQKALPARRGRVELS